MAIKTAEAIRHFKGVTNLAKFLGVTKQAIYSWGVHVNKLRGYELEVRTGGKLRSGDWPKGKDYPT